MHQEFIFNSSAREKYFNEFNAKYPEYETGIIGRSILGKDIDYYKIGKGKRHLLVVGAHHGTEQITSYVLYDFIEFLCKNAARDSTWNGINIEFLLRTYSYWIIPCVNPDGIEMNLSGLENSPLRERLIRMNGGGVDFAGWQANSRGVDLNRNYSFGFSEYKKTEKRLQICAGRLGYSGEYPESEPETRSVSGFIRALMPDAVVSLHSDGHGLFWQPKTEKQRRVAQGLAALIGYETSAADEHTSPLGLIDYAGGDCGIPSFALKIGNAENPESSLRLGGICDAVRRFLVCLPTHM